MLFGERLSGRFDRYPVMCEGEVLGWALGPPIAAFAANLLSHLMKKEFEQKKLGSEVLHLYREVNLIYHFSEKLSTAVGLHSVAQLALEEAGKLIDFRGGVVVFTDHGDAPEILARTGDIEAAIPQVVHPEMVSCGEREFFMCAPLKVEQRSLGAVVLLLENQSEKTAAKLKLLSTLALQAAAAMENAMQYKLAGEKSIELHRRQLENENLKHLDELKSRFYTNITHEFRTPLTVILGMAGLPNGGLHANMEDRFDMIRRNGSQMLRLVDQLLDLSRLEDHAIPLHPVRGDLHAFLRNIVGSFRAYATEKEISLDFQAFPEQLFLDFDPDKLHQVVGNLLSNAIKYTAAGGRIELAVRVDPGKLVLSVADNGAGIAEEDLPSIFDRFYQGDFARPGSGVGLSHARELVRLMGGDIEVKSRLGSGATFSVWLPLAGQAQPSPDIWSAPVLPGSDKPLILVIEDNPDITRYLQTCLLPFYQVETAPDGSVGMQKALESIPDIVISDVMMPGADGYEVCEFLKGDERTSHIPIILLTAKADTRSRIDGLRCGADAYLGKPFELEELLVRLEKLLALRKNLQAHYAGKALSGSPSSDEGGQKGEDAFIEKLKHILEENLSDENYSLPELCRSVGMSRSQLFRKMKALINEAPSTFIRMYRMNRARKLLEETDLSVSEIAYQVGFKDPAYFSYTFHEIFGKPPSTARL